MKKASEYRQHAEECRQLARGLPPGAQFDQLLAMAATWEQLATDRSAFVRRHPELSIGSEHGEEQAHHAIQGRAIECPGAVESERGENLNAR